MMSLWTRIFCIWCQGSGMVYNGGIQIVKLVPSRRHQFLSSFPEWTAQSVPEPAPWFRRRTTGHSRSGGIVAKRFGSRSEEHDLKQKPSPSTAFKVCEVGNDDCCRKQGRRRTNKHNQKVGVQFGRRHPVRAVESRSPPQLPTFEARGESFDLFLVPSKTKRSVTTTPEICLIHSTPTRIGLDDDGNMKLCRLVQYDVGQWYFCIFPKQYDTVLQDKTNNEWWTGKWTQSILSNHKY